MLKPQECLLLLLVPSGNRIAACRSGVQGGEVPWLNGGPVPRTLPESLSSSSKQNLN